MSRSDKFRWVVLFVLILGSAAMNFSNMIFASRPTDVMLQFGMSQAQLTAISSIGFVPGAVFSIILGNFFDRKGAKAVRYVAAVMLLAGGLFQLWRVFASDYVQLVIITFCAGTLFLPMQVLPAKMVEAWFPRNQIGTAMGLWGASSGIGITLAFFIGGALPSIQVGFAVCAALFMLVGVLWFLFGKLPSIPARASGAEAAEAGPEAAEAGVPDKSKVSLKSVLKSKNMWIIVVCCGVVASVPFMINTYMVNAFLDKGLDPAMASLLGVVFNLSLLTGSMISGVVMAKLGRYNLPFLVMCVGGGLLLLVTYLAPAGILTFVLLVCSGLVTAGTFTACLARVSLLHLTGDFGPENIGIAGGVNNTGLGVFNFVVPTVAAVILGSNYLGVFIASLALLAIVGVVGCFLIPELGERGALARKARGEE